MTSDCADNALLQLLKVAVAVVEMTTGFDERFHLPGTSS